MARYSGKYYYENILSSQNITAKSNIAWVADVTTLNLALNKKAHIFLCIDIHSNLIVGHAISQEPIRSTTVVKVLKKAIEDRCSISNTNKLIIHTDRGTQFSSKSYFDFVNTYSQFFIPSMSRENTPTDNAVAERFMRTLKQHTMGGATIEMLLNDAILMNPNFSGYRAFLNRCVQSLNQKPNKKSSQKSPQRHDLDVSTASMLMRDPQYPKALSNHIGNDFRRPYVEKFKTDTSNVVSILEEIAAKRAEVVNTTPFDNLEDNLALQIIDQRLSEIYALIKANPDTTKEFVSEVIEPIENSLESLHKKVDTLLPGRKSNREILPLRDPIDANLFPKFFTNAGSQAKRQTDLRQAQLRIAYTLLYHTGLRVNEIREITEEQISNAIASSQFNAIHSKTKEAHIHVLSDIAVAKLKKLKPEYLIVFQKYKFQYLFGKEKPIHEKRLISIINQDLKHTCKVANIPYNIKSHSFRINMISNLLKNTTVQNAAQIIGHSDIQSTMMYKRYALSKNEIKALLNQIGGNVD
jgi:integrase